MRYRTAAILAAILVGGMFCLPAVIFAVFPTMKQGSIPVLTSVIVFCEFRWVLALPIIAVLFTIAAFTRNSRREARR